MENKEQGGYTPVGNSSGMQPNATPVYDAPYEVSNTVPLEDPGGAPEQGESGSPEPEQTPRFERFRRLVLRIGIPIIGVLLLTIGAFGLDNYRQSQNSTKPQAEQFNNVSIPLDDLADPDAIDIFGDRQLIVNGTLKANEGIIATPASQPENATEGQIYYDQGRSELGYYNGSQFVYLSGEDGVTSLGGASGDIPLGDGISIVGGRLTASIPEQTEDGDGTTGNEIVDVATNAGLIRTGAGTTLNPFRVGLTACQNGRLLKSTGNGTWACAQDNDTDTDTTYSAGTGISFNGTQINNSGVLSFNIPVGSGLENTGTGQNVSLKLRDCAGGQLLQFSTINGWQCVSPSGGAAYSFEVSDGTNAQQIDNGNTVTFIGNEGLSATVSATDQVTYGLVDGGVTTVKLADGSVTSGKIVDGAIATIDLANGAVTNTKLANSNLSVNAGIGLSGGGVVALGGSTTLNLQACPAGNVLKSNGSSYACASDNGGTDDQQLSIASSNSGGTVNYTLTLEDGGSVNFSDRDTNTLYSAATGGGLALSGTAFGLIACADGEIIKYNAGASAYQCAADEVGGDSDTTYTAGTALSLSGTEFNLNVGTGLGVDGSNNLINTGILSLGLSGSDGGSATVGDAETISFISGDSLTATVSATNQVTYGLVDGGVTTLKLADGSVTSGKIADGTITTVDLSDGAVTNAKLTNSNLSVNAGIGLAGGGVVALGGSTTLSLQACADGEILKYDSGTSDYVCATDTPGTDDQQLSITSGTTGNTVNYTVSLEDGGSVNFDDRDTLYTALAGGGLQLNSNAFSLVNCPAGQLLKSNGSGYGCANDIDTDTTYTAGTGISFNGTEINNAGVLSVSAATTGGNANQPILLGGTAQNPTVGFTNGASVGDFWQWNGSEWELNQLPPDAVDGDTVTGNEVVGVTGAASGLVRSGAGTSVDPYTLAVNVGSGLSINGSNQLVNNGVLSFNVGNSTALVNNGTATNPIADLKPCASGEVLKYNTTGGTWDCATDDDTSGSTSFSVSDGSTSEAVVDGDTVTFIGNEGLVATVSATDTVTYGIVDGGVTTVKLSDGSVTSGKIANGTIATIDLSDGSVTSAKIADGTVANTDLANDSLTVSPGIGLAGGGLVSLGGSTTLSLQACADGEVLKYDGGTSDYICASDNGGTDSQTLSITSTTTGNTTNYDLSISGGNTVEFDDRDTLYTALAGGGLALNGQAFSLQTCAVGQILKSNNGVSPGYACAADNDTTYTAGTGISFNGTEINNAGVLSVSAATTGGNVNSPILVAGTAQNPQIGFTNGANIGDIWQWNGTAWELAQLPADQVEDDDSVVGNEVTGVTGASSGLTRSGTGTAVDPYTLAVNVGTGLSINGSNQIQNDGVISFNVGSSTALVNNGTAQNPITDLKPCASGEVLKYNTGTSTWDCAADNDTSGTTSFSVSDGTNSETVGNGDTVTFIGNQGLVATVSATDTVTYGIVDGGVTTVKLADGSVTSSKIQDGAITTIDLANGAVTNTKLANDSLSVTAGIGLTGGGVVALGGATTLNLTACADGQILKYEAGTTNDYVCAEDNGGTDDQQLSITSGITGNTVNYTVSLEDGGSVQFDDRDTLYTALTGGGLALNSQAFSLQTCAAGQLLKSTNGTTPAYNCATDNNTTYTAGTGISFNGTQINNAGVLSVTAATTGGNINSPILLAGTAQNPQIGFTNGASTGDIWQWNGTEWELAQIPAESFDGDTVTGNEVVGVTGSSSGLTRSGSGTNVDPYTLAVNVGSGISINGSNQIQNDGVISFNVGTSGALVNNGTAANPIADLKPCGNGEVLRYATGTGTWDCINLASATEYSFDISDGTTTQTINNQNTISFISGDGLLATVSATDQITYGIADSGITTIKLADGSVVTNKLGDGAVTTVKLADGAVTSAKIADGTVANTDLVNSSLTITAGNGLSGGGAVALGAATMLSLQACTADQILKYDSVNGWQCDTDEIGTGDGTGTDDQLLFISNDPADGNNTITYSLEIEDGNIVQFDDRDTLYTAATGGGLTLSNEAFSLMSCADGEILQYNSGSWQCVSASGGGVGQTYTAGTGLSLSGTEFNINVGSGLGTDGSNNLINTGVLTVGGSSTIAVGGSAQNPTLGFTNGTASGQFWQWNGTAWVLNQLPPDDDTTYTAGNGLVLTGTEFAINAPTCSGTDKLSWNGTAFTCETDVDTNTTYTAGAGININGSNQISNTGVISFDISDGTLTETIGNAETITFVDGNGISATVNVSNEVTFGIVDGGVTTVKIADGNVTNAKLANSGLTINAGDGLSGGGSVALGASTTLNLQACADGEILKYDNVNGWTCAFDNGGTDSQTLTLTPTGPDGNNTVSYNLAISGGNNVDFTDRDTLYTAATGGGLALNNEAFGLIACANNQIIKYNAGTSAYECAADEIGTDNDTTYTAGTGLSLSGTQFNVNVGSGLGTDGSNNLINTGVLTVGGSGAISSSGGQNPSISLSTSANFTQTGSVLNLSDSGAVAGTYGNSGVSVAQLTVDAKGRITSVSNRTLPTASASVTGVLSAADFAEFADDQDTTYTAGNGIAINGSNVISNTGVISFTISDGTTPQTIGDGETITFIDGDGLTATVSATNQVSYGIVDGGVTTVKIADGNVTNAKLANSSFTINAGIGLNGGGLVALGASTTLNLQSCADGEILKYDSGTSDYVCATDTPGTDDQTLSFNNSTRELTIEDGNTVTIPDDDTLYSAATGGGLALNGQAFSLIACADGEIVKYNAGAGAYQCATDEVGTDNDTTYTAGTGISISGGNVISNTGVLAVGGTGAISSSGGQNPDISLSTSGNFTQTGNSLDLANSGAVAGTYGNSGVQVAQLTVDAKGRVTSVSNRTLPTASASVTGVLSAADFATFADDQDTTYTAGTGLSLSGTEFSIDGAYFANNYFAQGGNSFGGLAILGTNDANSLAFETGGVEAMRILTNGNVGIGTDTPDAALEVFGANGTWSNVAGGQLIITSPDTTAAAITLNSTDTGGRRYSVASTGSVGMGGPGGLNIYDSTADAVRLRIAPNGNVGIDNFNPSTKLDVAGDIRVRDLANCDTINTDASGIFSCGTDSDTVYTAGAGIAINGSNVISNTGVISFNISDGTTSQTINNAETVTFVDGDGLNAVVSATNQVTYGIIDGGVTTVKLADGSVTTAKLGAGAVRTGNILNGEVQNADLANSSLTVAAGTGLSGGGTVALGASTTLSLQACANNQILKYNTGTSTWGCAADDDSQTLSFNNTTNELTITGGNTVTIPDDDTLYTAATGGGLTLNGTAFSLIACADGQIVKYNGTSSAYECAEDVDTNTTYSAGTGLDLTGTTFSNTGVLTVGGSGAIASSGGQNPTVSLTASGNFTQAGNSLDLTNSGATAGTYGNSGVNVTQLTVDAKGRVTAVSNRALPTASASVTGVLSSADFAAFAAKENALTFNGPLSRSGDTIGLNISATGSTATTSSASGLEVVGGALSLLRGCSNDETLKWNATSSVWECAVDGLGEAGVDSLNSLAGVLVIQGTTNQISVADNGTDTITLSLPQDIATTSSPTFAGLTINGASTFNGNVSVGSNSIRFADEWSIYQTGSGTNTQLFFTRGGTGGAELVLSSNGLNYTSARLSLGGSVSLGGTGNSYFNGGNVGIGTTNPTSLLDIENASGNAALDMLSANTSNTQIRFGDTDDSYVGGITYQHSDDSLFLFAGNSVNNRLHINASGNVGIGFGSPQYRLDVNTADAIAARISGRVIGADAVNNNELTTLGQVNGLISAGSVTSLNGFTGNVTLQGTTNQISVNNNAGTIGLSLPQDIATTSSVQFGGLGLGTAADPSALLTLTNGGWIAGINAAGNGLVNLIRLNSNDQIEFGTGLSIDGGLLFPENAGLQTLADMPITAASPEGTDHGYSLRLDATNVLTVNGESDGSGGVESLRVNVNGDLSVSQTAIVNGSIYTNGLLGVTNLTNCNTVDTDSGGIFSCGTDADTTYAAGTGLSLSGTTFNFDYSATLAGNPTLASNQTTFASTGIIFEGSTANTAETLLTVANPTADRTITFPDASGTVCISTNNCGYQASGNYFVQNGNSFGGLATLGTNDNNALAFETNGTSRMRITNNGNIGIGTNSPEGLLHLYGSGTNGAGSVLYLGDNYASFEKLVFVAEAGYESGLDTDILELHGSQGIRLTYTNSPGVAGLAMDNAGNIGIGTTSPTSKLDIASGSLSIGNGGLCVDNDGACSSVAGGIRLGPAGILPTNTAGGAIFLDGNVGIRTSNPGESLEVAGNIRLSDGGARSIIGPLNEDLILNAQPNSSLEGIHLRINGGNGLSIIQNGNVGIGVTNPSNVLEVGGAARINGSLVIGAGTSSTIVQTDGTDVWRQMAGDNCVNGTSAICWAYNGANSASMMMRLTTNGNLYLAGQILAGAPDIAENFRVIDPTIAPGHIVSAAPSGPGEDIYELARVRKSSQPYDSAAIGIVSTDPAIVLNSDGMKTGKPQRADERPVALGGRVPVKVTSENGAIKEGDYITASSVPGVGMKATESGRVVGMALSGWNNADPNKVGTILVFVNSHSYVLPMTMDNLKQATWNGGVVTKDTTFQASVMFEGPVTFLGDATFENITVNGHISGAGETPAATLSDTCENADISIEGSDTAGTITVKTAAATEINDGTCPAGELAKVEFAEAFKTAPHLSLTPTNAKAASLQAYTAKKQPEYFQITTNTPLEADTTYKFDYIVVE